MGKTANYGLPKWEKSDFIKMDDFNAAFGKIDETLKANADAVAAKAEAETVTACSSGIGSMNNYYTWGDSGVNWVSQTLDSDSGGYMASSQFNSSGKEYCYLVLGYDADWIKQKTAPSLSARG